MVGDCEEKSVGRDKVHGEIGEQGDIWGEHSVEEEKECAKRMPRCPKFYSGEEIKQ